MEEEEVSGLMKVLTKYERFHFVKFNILNIPFSNHFTRIEEFLKSGKEVDIARVDIKMPNWFKDYVIHDRVVIQAVDCLLLFYNPEIIASPPRTIDEFITYIRTYTIDNQGKRYGEEGFSSNRIKRYAAFVPLNSGWWMSPFFGGEDRDFLSQNLEHDSFIKVANSFKELYQSGLLPDFKDTFYEQMIRRFREGEVAMMLNGPWVIPALKELGQEFRIALIPRGSEGRFSPMGGQQWVMLSDKEVVKKVMNYLASDKVAFELYKYNDTIMPKESVLNNLDNNILAEQLYDGAVKLGKDSDYILYNFFSNDYIEYLNDKMSKEELFDSWKGQVRSLE